MLKRMTKTKHKSRQAFTLVELIVVLVILAVIAAMLVPSLIGFIKRAKRDKNDEMAHYALVACQSVILEYYGQGNIAENGIANKPKQTGGGGSAGDIRWDIGAGTNATEDQKMWGEEVLRLFDRTRDDEPYLLIFGTGRPNTPGVSNNDVYTVYYIAYIEDKNSPAVFFIDGKWQYTYPTDKPASISKKNEGTSDDPNWINYMKTDHGNVALQFYVVSNNTEIADNFWTSSDKRSLKSHSEPYF